MSIGGRKMEELEKKVNALLNTFLSQEVGNRLSEFAWGSFQSILIKMIRDYKEVKK